MPSKKFVLTLAVRDLDVWALELSQVSMMLSDRIGYTDTVAFEEVNEYVAHMPDGFRTAKIPAIKRVREIIACGLKEAKILVDTAERDGFTRAFGVTITHDWRGFTVDAG
jgi:ribosomal protein L7/L12